MKKQEKNTKIGVYKITSPSGRIYIGQSIDIDRRWGEHLKNKGKNYSHLKHSFEKYGPKNHIFEIIEECKIEELDNKEYFHKKQLIDEFGWGKALFCQLIDGKGGPKSQETKDKISKSSKGRIVSIEGRLNISKGKLGTNGYPKGKPRSNEFKENLKNNKERSIKISNTVNSKDNTIRNKLISESMLKANIKRSQEFKDKISILKKGISINEKPILQFDLEGNFIKEWPSIIKAKLWLGKGDIIGCVNNKHKTSGGFIWRFKTPTKT